MSSLVVASPYLFAQAGTHTAPFTFSVPASLEVQPTAATATFDGTGAGGAFLACLSFYSQSGQLLSRVYPQKSIAAGDVAQVSYAPFPGGMTTSSSGGSGIQFNTDNEGGYLDVTVNATDPGSRGMRFADTTNGGILIQSAANPAAAAGVQINATAGAIGVQSTLGGLYADAAGGAISIAAEVVVSPNTGNDAVEILDDGCSWVARGIGPATPDIIKAFNDSSVAKLGFFSKAPVVRQATPVTLANVISLLQAYGLCP